MKIKITLVALLLLSSTVTSRGKVTEVFIAPHSELLTIPEYRECVASTSKQKKKTSTKSKKPISTKYKNTTSKSSSPLMCFLKATVKKLFHFLFYIGLLRAFVIVCPDPDL